MIKNPELPWVYSELGYRDDIRYEHKEWLGLRSIELVVEEEKVEYEYYLTHRNIQPIRANQITIVKNRESKGLKGYVTNRIEYIKGMLNQVEGMMKEVYKPRRVLRYESSVEM